MYLQGVADFLDDILGGFALIGFSAIVGGLLWRLTVLDAASDTPSAIPMLRRNAWGIGAGAVLLATVTGLELIVKAAILASALSEFPFAAYAGSIQFKAGALRCLLALALVGTACSLLRFPRNKAARDLAAILAVALIIGGAWLVHAVARFENRALLMAITAVHQTAAGAWIGGVLQLLLLRELGRRDAAARAFWPRAAARFARLGIPAVLILIPTGLVLAWTYVGSLKGMAGTGYGSLVAVKITLLGCALGFALLNYRAARQPASGDIERKVPYYIETEFLVLVTVLFIAAGLASQPPAADIPEATASLSEVAVMFMPRLPRLNSPSHAEFLAGEAGRTAVVDKIPSRAAAVWSDYNHNVCGLFIALMAIAALLSYHPRFRWARFWPLGFAGIGLFLFFRNDPQTWPLGPMGFWESTLSDGEIMQHRITTLSTFAMDALELRVRRGQGGTLLPYVFPALMVLGAIILFVHGHAGFELKSEYLIRSTHTSIGFLAIIMAGGRWLELRLMQAGHRTEGRFAGIAGCLATLAVAMILLFYREPLY
ncbi:copper resistance D family protein [Candidatus Methylomicrobium oryzae]|uniref:copper resistance D family protein n=1 Tax=Candidatus Methylomicrobium oryzae TaxID=2802053 RepID=UPI0019222F9D|nr:CopD family protein [Methylomicrobium sp. RS1]MBL1262685.1 CopD family protein [Methylomicrobium sp. RS1]